MIPCGTSGVVNGLFANPYRWCLSGLNYGTMASVPRAMNRISNTHSSLQENEKIQQTSVILSIVRSGLGQRREKVPSLIDNDSE